MNTPRQRAAIVAVAPALMLAALIYHPYIAKLTNDAGVATELTADPTRWGLSHLAVGVAAGLLLLAFLAIGHQLREAGEQTWSALALRFVVMGSTLFAFLPAMEIGALAAHESGADVAAVLDELNTWFVPVLVAAALAFAVGVVGFAVGIGRSGVLGKGATGRVVAALVVLAVARFVPFGAALYVGGAAGVAALWPLARQMWKSADVAGADDLP